MILGAIGAFLIVFIIVALINEIDKVTMWATPIFWTGYILLIDTIIFKIKKYSLIRSNVGNFINICTLSVIFWLIFEFYNLFIKNWQYINLPENTLIRNIGYIWAFATIMPGVFLTKELVSLVIELPFISKYFINKKKQSIGYYLIILFISLGALFLLIPLILPPKLANYTAFCVWLSFFLLLDPINYLTKSKSILKDIELGNYTNLISLSLAGLICGLLWESINYKAYTKWIYHVPILPEIKIFEMPALGYLGFIPFAWELFAMYNFTQYLYKIIFGPKPKSNQLGP